MHPIVTPRQREAHPLTRTLTQTTHMREQAANYWTRAGEARQTQRPDGLGWARRPSAASAGDSGSEGLGSRGPGGGGGWRHRPGDAGGTIGQGRVGRVGRVGSIGGQPPHLSTGVCSCACCCFGHHHPPTTTHRPPLTVARGWPDGGRVMAWCSDGCVVAAS